MPHLNQGPLLMWLICVLTLVLIGFYTVGRSSFKVSRLRVMFDFEINSV